VSSHHTQQTFARKKTSHVGTCPVYLEDGVFSSREMTLVSAEFVSAESQEMSSDLRLDMVTLEVAKKRVWKNEVG
jgi:hypothetical protein